MSKSRNNHKWLDEDDYEYEPMQVYDRKRERDDRFNDIMKRREQKNKVKANTFNDDWD